MFQTVGLFVFDDSIPERQSADAQQPESDDDYRDDTRSSDVYEVQS